MGMARNMMAANIEKNVPSTSALEIETLYG
jgi:hypothetical protein